MDLFRGSRCGMHSFIIIHLCWLGWLCGLAFGQVISEALTGSANFLDIQVTCVANLVAFITIILKGKYYVYKRVKANHITEKLKNINGLKALTTNRGELHECCVVMLSFQMPMPNDSTKRFMRYLSNLYDVQSIFLQCLPLQSAEIAVDMCTDNCTVNRKGRCGCIVFNTVEDITIMLVHRMPGTLKKLSASLNLLPSLRCLKNGCHGCNRGLLHVENDRLREGDPQVESPAAVCEILDLKSIHKVVACICIPLRSANDDEWTNQLIKLLKPEDEEFRGAVIRKGRTNASSALENYKAGNGLECDAEEKYKFASLIVVPRFMMLLMALVLTFWLKVDGFSSHLFSMLAVARYFQVQSDFPAHSFLARTRVKSNASKTNVCQVLFFTDALQTWLLSPNSFVPVYAICSISWMVLVALEGGANKWYHTHSMPPSKPRIAVILVGICISLFMDGYDLNLCLQMRRMRCFRGRNLRKVTLIICAIIVLQILCIVVCSAIAGVLGINFFGRWIYSALQCLVWLKWIIGKDILSRLRPYSRKSELNWWYHSCGLYIGCSAILVNAILAGIRAKWEFSIRNLCIFCIVPSFYWYR